MKITIRIDPCPKGPRTWLKDEAKYVKAVKELYRASWYGWGDQQQEIAEECYASGVQASQCLIRLNNLFLRR